MLHLSRLHASLGTPYDEAIFKYYTKKQWDKFPEELDASVLARIPAGKGMGGVLWGGTVMWDGGVRSCYRTRSFSNHVASPWLVCFFFFFFFFFLRPLSPITA